MATNLNKITINFTGVPQPTMSADCDFDIPVDTDTHGIDLEILKSSVNNYVEYINNYKGIGNTFAQMIVRKEYLIELLKQDVPAFRIYIGARNNNPNPDEYKLIIVPVDVTKTDILDKGLTMIECEKPPGCANNVEGALLIRESDREKMKDAELQRLGIIA